MVYNQIVTWTAFAILAMFTDDDDDDGIEWLGVGVTQFWRRTSANDHFSFSELLSLAVPYFLSFSSELFNGVVFYQMFF